MVASPAGRSTAFTWLASPYINRAIWTDESRAAAISSPSVNFWWRLRLVAIEQLAGEETNFRASHLKHLIRGLLLGKESALSAQSLDFSGTEFLAQRPH